MKITRNFKPVFQRLTIIYDFAISCIFHVIYLSVTHHTLCHTLKATMFSQKNADMKEKYNMNPKTNA